MQAQLYASPEETITSPILGYYNVPKDIFTTVLASSFLMLPYMMALLIGATAEAEWLYPTRLYGSITAMTVLICRAIFTALIFGQLSNITDIAFTYLLVEGAITVLEGLKSA
jgi:hypothetical protein